MKRNILLCGFLFLFYISNAQLRAYPIVGFDISEIETSPSDLFYLNNKIQVNPTFGILISYPIEENLKISLSAQILKNKLTISRVGAHEFYGYNFYKFRPELRVSYSFEIWDIGIGYNINKSFDCHGNAPDKWNCNNINTMRHGFNPFVSYYFENLYIDFAYFYDLGSIKLKKTIFLSKNNFSLLIGYRLKLKKRKKKIDCPTF